MKLCVVIPVFNGGQKIVEVLEAFKKQIKLPLLVIDDGSDVPVKLQSEESTWLIRHNKNLGKGVALQRAVKECIRLGFTHMLSFDGDGQHLVSEIEKLVIVAESHPEAIIVGARKFKEGVPGISQFGRKFSNFWVYYQTHKKVSDSQSGMRVYPLNKIKNFHFFTRRYDFEIEVLVRSMWSGVEVIDVDVEVFYPEKSERISHFHKFKDNARITFLNILLIAYSLLFFQRSIAKVIVAGIFGGILSVVPGAILPWFLAVVLSVVFRINFILILIVVACLKLTA